jgi:hypothetical protein
VGLARNGSPVAQEYAAAVLAELATGAAGASSRRAAAAGRVKGAGSAAYDDEALCPEAAARLSAISAAGGIAPLVDLLKAGSTGAQEAAAGALCALASTSENRAAISVAGGIVCLCQLLHDGTPQAHEHANDALSRLAYDSPEAQMMIAKKLVSLLLLDSAESKRRCAHTLRRLAANNAGAPVRIVNAGGIAPLVAVLGSGSSEAKSEAIGALACLAHDEPNNQLAIATGLVKLLDVDKAEGQEHVERIMARFGAADEFRSGLRDVVNVWLGWDGKGQAGRLRSPGGRSRGGKNSRVSRNNGKVGDSNTPLDSASERAAAMAMSALPFWKRVKLAKMHVAETFGIKGSPEPGIARPSVDTAWSPIMIITSGSAALSPARSAAGGVRPLSYPSPPQPPQKSAGAGRLRSSSPAVSAATPLTTPSRSPPPPNASLAARQQQQQSPTGAGTGTGTGTGTGGPRLFGVRNNPFSALSKQHPPGRVASVCAPATRRGIRDLSARGHQVDALAAAITDARKAGVDESRVATAEAELRRSQAAVAETKEIRAAQAQIAVATGDQSHEGQRQAAELTA